MYLTALFFTSSSLLALEISLMRVLRVEGFGNFTFSAIALALTGFGAGGTIVFLLKKYLSGREKTASLFSAVIFIFTLGLGYYISGRISFDPLRIIWDKNQLFRLLIRYFIYTVPFIAGSTFIVLAFSVEKPGKVYFYNLSGSGLGIFIILISLFLIPPNRIFIIPMSLSSVAVILLIIYLKPGGSRIITFTVIVFAGYILFSISDINIIPYKGLKLALNLPDAKIIERELSPFGTLEVVKSSKIRSAAGLSLSFEDTLPGQHGLYLDGDSLSTIDRIKSRESLLYLRYQTQSAVYSLYTRPDVFIIGLGGGISAERALVNSAANITVTEENPHLPGLLKDTFKNHNNNFFNENNITIIRNNGRNYLNQTDYRWDIIEISETDSLVSSVGGIYSTDTDYTLTVEAFHTYLEHVRTDGAVSITVLLKYPPRNILKLINLAKHALEKKGIEPEACIAVIRSWSTGTVIIKKTPFTREETAKIKSFCDRMFFDLVYYPGINPDEVNIYNVVKDELYYKSVSRILKNDTGFRKNYPFNLKYPTDDRPYFSYFFKIKKLPVLLKEMGHKWILAVEGGYVVLFSTFIITALFSFLLIVTPLFFSGKKIQGKKIQVLLYFGLLGISYMLIEIVLIKKVSKYLANPIYSSSAIISALLISSGIGSYFSDYFSTSRKKLVSYSIVFIAGYMLIILLAADRFFVSIESAPLLVKLAFSILIMIPLGAAMGIPFPSGVSVLKNRSDRSIPWAWSINGYFSVIASTGAVLIATNIGLTLTGIIAIGGYICALLVFPK